MTGVSGSGKSSLAFDTLYGEGQRRYVESFSAYARQFLERMDRPDVDAVEGILPAVAIERKNHIRSSRSTVGTITEIADYLKLLFARAGTLHCDDCGRVVVAQGPGAAAAAVLDLFEDQQVLVGFPLVPDDIGGVEIAEAWLLGRGWFRILAEGSSVFRRLDEDGAGALGSGADEVIVVADRTRVSVAGRRRLVEALENAMHQGRGRAVVVAGETRCRFTNQLHCAPCDRAYPAPVPALFSFNTPVGACDGCNGFGRVIDVDEHLVIPDTRLSVAQGCIKPWLSPKMSYERQKLTDYCARAGIDVATPWRALSEEARRRLFDGDRPGGWYGVRGWFQWLERKAYRMHVRVFLSRYRAYTRCADCDGRRLNPAALRWRVDGLTLPQLNALPIRESLRRLDALELGVMIEDALGVVRTELQSRLRYLVDVGLGYLTLDRSSRTLSGGEVQRVNLTSALGSKLVGTLYVLDEPSVGLHARDNDRLMRVLRSIRDLGNTLVVVEHDEAVIRAADHVIDLGPAAGADGGQLMYAGSVSGLISAPQSVTGTLLRRPAAALPPVRDRVVGGKICLMGARTNNLQGVDFEVPLGAITCVTGVSGSGKSSLVVDTLYRGLMRARGEPTADPGEHDRIDGEDELARVVLIDQTPVASSPRSNPATFLKAWDGVRQLFAREEASVRRGYSPATFSFNTAGGRCDVCDGSGYERVEMQFLSDLFLTCDGCGGSRFQGEVLAVRHHGLTIADVLNLTVDSAAVFFAHSRKVCRALEPLRRVGLGYLRLGQPLSTLSGGESQRVKVADGLRRGIKDGATLFILDEPTSGLHLADVTVLNANLRALVESGHTVVVIEHHLDVVRAADHVVDLGPDGGDEGGRIVVQGPPAEIAAHETSHTGHWLRTVAPDRGPVPPAVEDEPVIVVKGARVHNLRDVDVEVPRGQMTVVTGPSGSGKSSLAFDVLFAEGQRRFIDCLSPYARQYIQQAGRPDLDELFGIPPTVAIEQRTTRTGRRSTVATVTELYHFLRLLFARAGVQHCHVCGAAVQGLSAEDLRSRIVKRHSGTRIMVLAPIVKTRKGWHKEVLARAKALGIPLLRIDGALKTAAGAPEKLERYQDHNIDYVFLADHVVRRRGAAPALDAAIDRALVEGHGTCYVLEQGGAEHTYSLELYCDRCCVGFDPPEPRLFSFHGRRSGACLACDGLGVSTADEDDPHPPLCEVCGGARLGPVGRAVRVGDCSIDEVCRLTAGGLIDWLSALELPERRAIIAAPIRAELIERCRFLVRVGLDYLSLSRGGHTLSGGEAQRVRLAAQLASRLCGVLYVLDEPTIGLHPADNDRLLGALDELKARGNTVVVVEHDAATIAKADRVIDMGPGGGSTGGHVVAIGTPEEIRANPDSLTGQWLDRAQATPPGDRAEPTDFLTLEAVSKHNLRDITVRFPRARMTVVTGVSGSGKSTLVRDQLMGRLQAGVEGVDRVIEVDQSPIGRTPRSTPSTYIKIMDRIRKLFAALPESQVRGYRPGRFSFNVAAGRCGTCAGQGAINMEMAFLPNVYVPCEDCGGRRYNPQTLRVHYRGHSIADVLAATIDEALVLFEAQPRIRAPLQLMADLGLGYLTLGQSSPSLSGGEAQRIKLVAELARRSRGRTVYVLDEPSTGLHMSDLALLIDVLHRLVARGDTVVVIEHNMDFVLACDWLIDLGPGGGERGGRLMFEGPPTDLIGDSANDSLTGKYLRGDC